jgi:peptidoglycan-N-acetylglucosamine deacetylase
MKPIASLSLDLDNLWSYMKVHNDAGWQDFPSYLDLVVPRVLDFLDRRDLALTFFVVGQDAALPANRDALKALGRSRHEVGNHSFAHEPWLHRYTAEQVADELRRAEDAIATATRKRPEGFRGPGFSVSQTVLEVLADRGYRFDASTLPTFIGPLARAYYFMTARLGSKEKEERGALFGTMKDVARPVTAYRWRLPGDRSIVEIPVTVFPVARVPFHLSYVLYLSTFSPRAARLYFRSALEACRRTGVEPSLLLHPLDFLGGDDVQQLAFFPAMNLPGAVKMQRVSEYLSDLAELFEVLPMGVHARALETRPDLPARTPDFPPSPASA